MISAKVVLDSVSTHGKRITTFLLEYPRFFHSEFLTHRSLSRNAASSRAVPIEKMMERVRTDPALPVFWGANQKGMQSDKELGLTSKAICEGLWLKHRDQALEIVQGLQQMGLHKQLANRLLEPWLHIAVLCTATDYGNFFNLRYHKAAQPEFQQLARLMYEARESSRPQILSVGQWHLPFITAEDDEYAFLHLNEPEFPPSWFQKISAARCARLSYYNVDGSTSSYEADLALYEKLMGGVPKHASPTEHQAGVTSDPELCSGNFSGGWMQWRKMIEGENLPEFTPPL